MSTSRKTLAAVTAGAVALASAAYAVGSTSAGGDAVALGGGAGAAKGQTVAADNPWIKSLASKLGVDADKLADALTAVRKEQQPNDNPKDEIVGLLATELGVSQDKVEEALKNARPEPPHPPKGPDGPRAEFAADLAKELGISQAKVEAAFKKVRPAPGRGGAMLDLGDVAKDLGVSESDLKAALEKVRPEPPRIERRIERHAPDGPGHPGGGPHFAFGFADDFTADLAKELGVDEAKVKSAFENVRDSLQQKAQERHDAFVKSLADKLGLSVEKVQQGLGSVPKGHGFGGRHRP